MCNPVRDFQIKKGKMLDVVRHHKRRVTHQAWIILLKMKNAFKVRLSITRQAGVSTVGAHCNFSGITRHKTK